MTPQATIDFLLDQLGAVDGLSARKMFGEYCLYRHGKPIGLVCDAQLYLKPTPGALALMRTIVHGQPYPGAKPHLQVAADLWEDREWLAQVIRTVDDELPPPKPRRPRQPGTSQRRA